jgi:hypothetical protein
VLIAAFTLDSVLPMIFARLANKPIGIVAIVVIPKRQRPRLQTARNVGQYTLFQIFPATFQIGLCHLRACLGCFSNLSIKLRTWVPGIRAAEKINYPILLVSSSVFFVARCHEYFNMHSNARLEYRKIFYAILR